jgi:hypothetical protein
MDTSVCDKVVFCTAEPLAATLVAPWAASQALVTTNRHAGDGRNGPVMAYFYTLFYKQNVRSFHIVCKYFIIKVVCL